MCTLSSSIWGRTNTSLFFCALYKFMQSVLASRRWLYSVLFGCGVSRLQNKHLTLCDYSYPLKQKAECESSRHSSHAVCTELLTGWSVTGARFLWRHCIFVANTKKWEQLFLTTARWLQLQLHTWECCGLSPGKHLSLLVSLLIWKSGCYLEVSQGICVLCRIEFTEPFNAFSTKFSTFY